MAETGKFKVGDRVNYLCSKKVFQNAKIIEVNNYSEWVRVEDNYGCVGLMNFEEIEPTKTGPVRTVTRREIVPGDYGDVHVEAIPFAGFEITYSSYDNPHKIREAARIFNEIADALEEGE